MENHNYEEDISQAKYQGLHIQKGDILEINVLAFDEIASRPFNKTTLSTTSSSSSTQVSGNAGGSENNYQVSTEGNINFPVLGEIYCSGMTKQQLKEDLENRLKRYLTEPMVTVKLTNFNISVLGEVANPGQKTSTTEKLNIFQALALAGDIKQGGNKTQVKLIRSNETSNNDEVISLNLTEKNIVNSPYYFLQQNDILYVEPDKNTQIEANNNANVDKILRYGTIALGVVSILITLTRLK